MHPIFFPWSNFSKLHNNSANFFSQQTTQQIQQTFDYTNDKQMEKAVKMLQTDNTTTS